MLYPRNDSKIFHLVCPSIVGALPLGEIVTSKEDAPTILEGLELLKTILPDKAFYGRGSQGPQIFMTDDSNAERNALSQAWIEAILLMCIFHVLQAQWTWLWCAKHGIHSNDKVYLLNLFRKVLYAETEDELSKKMTAMMQDPVLLTYPQYKSHLDQDTFPKLDAWSLARRSSLPTSSNNTNNLVEASFRYTKDIQFMRQRAFNLPDLLSNMLDKSQFYAEKCVDAANNKIKTWLRNCNSKYHIETPNIDPREIVKIDEDSFLVPSETKDDVKYIVDLRLRYCSCYQGRFHGPCKHKLLVSETFQLSCFDVIPVNNPEVRERFMYLGTGKSIPLDWFLPLQEEATIDDRPEGVGIDIESQTMRAETPGNPNNDDRLESMDDNFNIHEDKASKTESQTMEDEENDNFETDTNDDVENALNSVDSILDKLREKLKKRIPSDCKGYKKALEAFSKQIDKLPQTEDATIQKALFSFGHYETEVCIYL